MKFQEKEIIYLQNYLDAVGIIRKEIQNPQCIGCVLGHYYKDGKEIPDSLVEKIIIDYKKKHKN